MDGGVFQKWFVIIYYYPFDCSVSDLIDGTFSFFAQFEYKKHMSSRYRMTLGTLLVVFKSHSYFWYTYMLSNLLGYLAYHVHDSQCDENGTKTNLLLFQQLFYNYNTIQVHIRIKYSGLEKTPTPLSSMSSSNQSAIGEISI